MTCSVEVGTFYVFVKKMFQVLSEFSKKKSRSRWLKIYVPLMHGANF